MAVEDIALERLEKVEPQSIRARNYIKALKEIGVDTSQIEVELEKQVKEAEDMKRSINKHLKA